MLKGLLLQLQSRRTHAGSSLYTNAEERVIATFIGQLPLADLCDTGNAAWLSWENLKQFCTSYAHYCTHHVVPASERAKCTRQNMFTYIWASPDM
jgi:hypothetical protein